MVENEAPEIAPPASGRCVDTIGRKSDFQQGIYYDLLHVRNVPLWAGLEDPRADPARPSFGGREQVLSLHLGRARAGRALFARSIKGGARC